MKPWNLLPLTLLLAACNADEASNAPSGSDSGTPDGAGGTGGATIDGGGGTGGTDEPDAMSGTRCDNGVGAGGDGCAENWSILGTSIGFSATPAQLTTAVEPTQPAQLRGISFYTIPDAVLDTLQNGTTLRALADNSIVPAETAWEDNLTWENHTVTLTLTPSSPLQDGWYAVDVMGSLDTGHSSLVWIPQVEPNHYQSAFRVGSAPVLRAVGACGGSVSLAFSEAVVVPDPAPVTVFNLGLNQLTPCTRDTSAGTAELPTAVATLLCPTLNDIDGARIVIAEGIATSAQLPLKTAAGETSAEILLDTDLGTNTCRTWQETEIPTF